MNVRDLASRGSVAISLLAAAAFAGDASAQTWTGAGADDHWSTGANWSGGVAPASASTTVVTFPAPAGSADIDMPWTINQVDLQAPFLLSGQTLTMAGAGAEIHVNANPTTISAPITLAGPTTALLDGSSPSVRLTGGIGGSGPLNLASGGSAFVLITGTNTFTGGMNVGGHMLVTLDGSSAGPVTVDAESELSAIGTIAGPVVVGSATGPGVLDLPGLLSTGGLSVAGSSLTTTIGGTTPGTQYGTANVTGTVDITDGALTVGGSYVPAVGDVFTIITNDGTDPVVGTFQFLSVATGPSLTTVSPVPEGTTFTFNGTTLRVSYVGGTGNDVTLTAINPPVAPPPTPPEPVPTLSEWALMLLAALVLSSGMRAYSRRR